MNNIFPRVLVVLSQLKRDDWIPLICPFNSKEDANKLVLPTKCLLLDKVYSDWLDVLTAGIMAATGQLFAASVTSHIHYLHIVATGNDKNNMWAGNLDTENVSFVWLFLEISEWSRYTEMPLHSHFSCKAPIPIKQGSSVKHMKRNVIWIFAMLYLMFNLLSMTGASVKDSHARMGRGSTPLWNTDITARPR